jgi:hypothetical protein
MLFNSIHFIDYSSNIEFNNIPKYFRDQLHLNKDGAHFFSSLLSTKLKL